MAHGADDGGEVVIEQHDVGRLPGHIGALQAHGKAHIRRPQGGSVVDPIPRDSHHLAKGAIGLNQAQLLLRCHPGKHQASAVFQQLPQLHIADQIQVGPLNHPHGIGTTGWAFPACRLEQANLLGNRLGREPVIPGDHGHLDAGLVALADGLGHLGAGRVVEGQQTHQHQVGFQLVVGDGEELLSPLAHGYCKHPIAPAGKVVVGGNRKLTPGRLQGHGPSVAEFRTAVGQHLDRGPLGEQHQAIALAHNHTHAAAVGIERQLP